jgi:hypothetical protein
MNYELQQMLRQAIQAFQDGYFDRAESILKRILQGKKSSDSPTI